DNSGQSSKAPVTVLITPKAEPPVANAGNNQTVSAGDTVTLDGSASTDSDGTITSYQWTQTSGTPTVSLSAPNAASTTFVAPQDIAANTTLAFELTVTDNSGKSSKAPVTVLITPKAEPVTKDRDSDGLLDEIDLNPDQPSDDFSDEPLNGTSTGTVISRPSATGQNLTILDGPPGKGIRIIYAAGDPSAVYRIEVCDGATTYPNVTLGDDF